VNVKAIPIELIRLDGGTQIRACSTYQTKVDEYALAMTEDADFPPLTVFWDSAEYWLADGFHRLGAYNWTMQTLGPPGMNLPCEVIEGTQREAIIYACGVNAAHGMPRTNPDKQNAVRTMLTNPLVMIDLETGKPWNDHEIARRCVVGPDMVRRHRAAIYRSALDNGSNAEAGAEEQAGSEERTVTRGGTTYTMNTANIGKKAEQPDADADVQRSSNSAAPDAGADVQPRSNSAAPCARGAGHVVRPPQVTRHVPPVRAGSRLSHLASHISGSPWPAADRATPDGRMQTGVAGGMLAPGPLPVGSLRHRRGSQRVRRSASVANQVQSLQRMWFRPEWFFRHIRYGSCRHTCAGILGPTWADTWAGGQQRPGQREQQAADLFQRPLDRG
jgi:hypothetical protein